MSKPGGPGESVAQVAPEELGELLPTRPLVSSQVRGWNGVVLQRYRHPPSLIDTPPLRDHALVVNLSGPTLIEERRDGCRDRRWADSGQISLTPAGQSVTRVLNGRPEVLVIHLAATLLGEVAEAVYGTDPALASLLPRLASFDRNIEALGRLLLAEAEAGDPGSCLVADMLARAITVRLLRDHSNLSARRPQRPAAMPDGRLRRVIEHMHAHMEETLTLARLAGIAGLSQSQFARAFREATGQSPHHHLISLRVTRARHLLQHSGLSVIEIGLQCGFEQPSHFATMFRKVTGMAPRAWRSARRG